MSARQRPTVAILVSPAHPGPYNLPALEELADIRLSEAAGLEDALQGADVLLLWDFFSSALQDAWDGADALAWVHVAATGVDSILFPALRDSSLIVTNAHGVFDTPIAEFVLASVLAHDKQLHVSKEFQRRHVWNHRDLQASAGNNVLVVGTGGIGRATARLLHAVGLNVQGVGRRARDPDPDFGTVHASTELAKIAGWADHLVLLAPLTDSTRGMLDADVLAAMKPSAHLVNVGRGALVDEPALIDALCSGRIAAASLDVVATEPLPQDSVLWDMDQVHISAHLSGNATGWREALADQFLAQLRRWTAGEPLTGVVDKVAGYVSGASPRTLQN